MVLHLEDYGLIGDTQAAALVGDDGSIDWLCLPRFDSGACFAALLGERDHGWCLLAPTGEHRATGRSFSPCYFPAVVTVPSVSPCPGGCGGC